MHSHKSEVRTKNPAILQQANHDFFGLGGGLTGGERSLKFIKRFLAKAKIFADEPTPGAQTVITIDFKEIKVASRADTRRPLTLLKLNGVALMYLRPDHAKNIGILLKVCPHHGVRLTDRKTFDLEVSRFNSSVRMSDMAQGDEPEEKAA